MEQLLSTAHSFFPAILKRTDGFDDFEIFLAELLAHLQDFIVEGLEHSFPGSAQRDTVPLAVRALVINVGVSLSKRLHYLVELLGVAHVL